jgi:hypothetical protein
MTATKPQEREVGEGEGEQPYTTAIDTLKAELERLRAEVADLQKAALEHDRPAASVVVLANDQLAPAQGFYPVERTEDGVAFCWTGPSPQFSFSVNVDRFAGANLRLEGINFIDYERQKDVRLTVDGEAVPVTAARGGIGAVLTAALPPRTGEGPTQLEFTLPTTLTPPGTEDTRALGFAFYRLTVTARK